jgi:hypothetical protein
MKSPLVLSVLFISILVHGCTNRTESNNSAFVASTPQPTATQTSPANQAAIAEATPADEKGLSADFPGTAGVTDKKNDIDGAALLTSVRTGQQENFDRIVFEFAGGELPNYHIEYVDQPVRSCGSGDVVSLKGDAWLEIGFRPANAHNEQGEPTVKTRELAPNHKIVKELKSTCDFEADVEWVAGVASPNKYRVLELRSPTRLVVDIKH